MNLQAQSAWREGLQAARKNGKAALVLQIVAVILVVAYFQGDLVQQRLDLLGTLTQRYSPWAAILMTTFFGGAVPLLVEAFERRKKGRPPRSTRAVLFTLLLWAWNGFLVEQLYRFQSTVFGDELQVMTIVAKVMVDQFLWVPLYVAPFFTAAYLWRDQGFSKSKFQQALREQSFSQRLLVFMITNWLIWIPAVSVIYAFPAPLQLLLMNLILVFWSLIMSCFSQPGPGKAS